MRVLIAGDFAPCYRIVAQIDKSDFSCFDPVRHIIQSADYSIVNFECPVIVRKAEPVDKTGPTLFSSENAMECVAQAGFKCVTLANNHFRDYGQVGVEDTISTCEKYGIDYVGGGRTRLEADRVLYKTIEGHSLAIINCCEHEWSIANEYYGGANPLDIVSISQTIHVARKLADYVLVIIHGGTELYSLPTPRMKDTYRFFIEQGADAIVNHHQHCYSGYEVYQGKPIFYGIGNFCFDKENACGDKLWEEGYMVELQLGQEMSFKLFPFVQCSNNDIAVRLIEDQAGFYSDLSRLNGIIADDLQLKENYEKMISEKGHIIKEVLSPFSSPVLIKLVEKNLLPSFVTKTRIRKLLAHIQCESHRDILLSELYARLRL